MPLRAEQHDAVTVLHMEDGENRFNPTTLDALEAALTTLEEAEGPRAAVLTGSGKFFSNGLDLDWMGTAAEGEPARVIERMQVLFARLLVAPFATVAALNGHAFAGGGLLALACDERVMREDRGFFCLPEVDLGMPFTPGLTALVLARLAPQAAHRTMTAGVRLASAEALALGVVDAVAPEDEVLGAAIARAQALAPKAGPNAATIRTGIYGRAAEALRAPFA